MSADLGVIGPALAGRTAELEVVGALLERAATGGAGAFLITGDAGVGKTALVQHACERADPSTLVLAGTCLPLTSMTVPFLALRSALREARLAGAPLLGAVGPTDSPSNVPIVFDAWLEDLCRDRLVVLSVDDLHWADQSTLDVLMYVLAGPADRRLAVIGTIRRGEVGDGHPLQRWLADVRRLPRIERMTLDNLDRVATGEQIAALLGATAHQSLVEQVFTHTLGNPYLNRLIVSGLQQDARSLPPDYPADLKSAVLQSWRRLPPAALELARILAVGGAPLHASDLIDVLGNDLDDVQPLLRAAVEAGALDRARDDRYWFHHPMSAEVLEEGLTDEERRRWHAAFANHGEKQMADDPAPAAEQMVAVADHHHLAGHPTEAYRWALRASEAVQAVGGANEMLRLLRRAIELRNQLPYASESEQELLMRLMAAAAEAGAHEEELRAVDLLLDGSDSEVDPLLVAELLVRRAHLRFSTGRRFLSQSDMREAVQVSSADPASWQHAFALAELAHAGIWQDDPEVAANAQQSLIVARTAGNPRALSYALTANAVVEVVAEHCREGLVFATEAVGAAVLARDYWAFCHAAMWEGNALDTWSTRVFAEVMRRRREELVALGAPHTYTAWLSAVESVSRVGMGEWRVGLLLLRDVLGSDPGPLADVNARLTAARLAAWQGRTQEAAAHLARADELFAGSSEFLNFEFDAVRAEVCLAAGNPASAYEAAMAGATSPGVPPTMSEWLMPLASRAIADQVQARRDAGRDPSALLAELDALTTRFPTVIRDFGGSTEQWELQIEALGELYSAEVGRARQDPDNGAQWILTADACHEGMLAWEEAYACWRGAESLLMRGHPDRTRAASVLRRGLGLAEELEAGPIGSALRDLARSARISVDKVPVRAAEPLAELPGLTVREREILGYVVAGRTYGDIARALVVSEKTVSSHISNLLRKTGAANRVDLARLAVRADRGVPR